jgi:hypothetical protein
MSATTKPTALPATLAVLSSFSIKEAIEVFETTANCHRLVPDAFEAHLPNTLNEIMDASSRLALSTASDLVTNQTDVIRHLTGVHFLSEYQPTIMADRLHRYRNVIAAIAATTALSFGGKADAVYTLMPNLKRRTTHLGRPLTDDEILLARVDALRASLKSASSQRAVAYALTDAGMAPVETTQVGPVHLGPDLDRPELVEAPGNQHLSSRLLSLDGYSSRILARRLEHVADPSSEIPIDYKATKVHDDAYAAGASVSAMLSRLLKDIKVANDDVIPSSITLWRVTTVLKSDGDEAAARVSGRSSKEQMLASLGITPEQRARQLTPKVVDFASYVAA